MTKRTRFYEGEQLERRRAYQREYGRRKRAEEKAAKQAISGETASQQHRPPKTVEKYAAMPTPKQEELLLRNRAAEPLCMETWQKEIEADKARRAGGWHDEGKLFFERWIRRTG
jgi:hypothetical protein